MIEAPGTTIKPEPSRPKFRYLVAVVPSMALGGLSPAGYELLPVAASESKAMTGFPGARTGDGSADAMAAPTTRVAAALKIDRFLTLTPGFCATTNVGPHAQ